MRFIASSIPDVIVVEPDIFYDHRGLFLESWHKAKFKEGRIDAEFVQDNHSKSIRGTLRGLHYQINYPQGKLIRVIQGTVFDVVVDIRRSSPTFGKWIGEYLTSENKRILWVPPGFAHGFYVISEIADICYKCTDYYYKEDERCIVWNDPELGIHWPLIEDSQPILSVNDSKGTLFKDAELFT